MVSVESSNQSSTGGGPVFRVSDAAHVPLRGYLLRLRRLDGRPSIRDLAPGRELRLRAPDGAERSVHVVAYSMTGGRAAQNRLDTYGQLDVLISDADAQRDGRPVEIGWTARPAGAAARVRA